MMSLKQYLDEQEKEKNHPNGTYVAANLSKESTKELYDWVVNNKINNPIDPNLNNNEYHTTVVYSRKGIPDAKGEDLGLPINAKITGWEIFPTQTGTKCLVARVDVPELVKAHNTFRKKYGATYDFATYKPHITVSYDYGEKPVPEDVPGFEITFDKKKFAALDPAYVPSNNKDK